VTAEMIEAAESDEEDAEPFTSRYDANDNVKAGW